MAGDSPMTSLGDSDPLKSPAKEEAGILVTMAGVYVKCRDAVKGAYDEIQYWRGVKHSFVQLKGWLVKNKEKVVNLRECAVSLFTDPGDLWGKLEKTEELFDRFDDIAFYETLKFDKRLASLENSFDKLQLLPNTDIALDAFQKNFLDVDPKYDITINDNQKQKLEQIAKERTFAEEIYSQNEEKRVIEASSFIISSALAESKMYHNWARASVNHYNQLEQDFTKLDGIKMVEMEAAWYQLEDCNANNKKIRHMSAATKLYLANLGLDIYDKQIERAIELDYSNNADNMINAITNAKPDGSHF